MRKIQDPSIYVVSLERAVERRASISRQANDLHCPVNFIDAVDARNPEALKAHAPLGSPPSYVGLAEWGCALSHHLAFKKFLETDADFCIILEDDVQIGADFSSLCSELHRIFSRCAGLRTVANLCQVQLDEAEQMVLGRRTTIHLSDTIKARKVVAFRGNLWGTPGYAINRAAAQSLLKRSPDRADAWKWFINENYLDEIWLVRPSPVEHDYSFPSYIENSRQTATRLNNENSKTTGDTASVFLRRCSKKARKLLRKFIDPIISISS